MVLLKNMFSGFKKQMRRALVPKARLHIRGETAVVYRRWFGIDISVSEKTSARLLPTLLQNEKVLPVPAQPKGAQLARTSRVVPRRSLGLGLAQQAQMSPLDLLKQGARGALAVGATHVARTGLVQTVAEGAAQSRQGQIAFVNAQNEHVEEGHSAIVSDTASLSTSEQEYITRMQSKTTYGGTPEIYALSQLLKKAISVYELTQEGGLKKRLAFVPEQAEGELALRLSHMGSKGAHYDPIPHRITQDELSPGDAQTLKIPSVAGDGQCLWNAIGHLIEQEPGSLRLQTVDYLSEHARDRPAYLGGARTLLEDAVDASALD